MVSPFFPAEILDHLLHGYGCPFLFDVSFMALTPFPITFSTISITFCMAFAIRSSNNKIAALTISPNSSGLCPFCSTDSFYFIRYLRLLSSTISASDTPLTIARSTVLFHSMRISLSDLISSAFGLFLPTFFVARYGPFFIKKYLTCPYHQAPSG